MKHFGFPRSALLSAVVLVVGATTAAGAAPARTGGGSTWSIQQTPNRDERYNSLSAVSCTGTGWCMAVGGPSLLTELWDGVTWSIRPIPPVHAGYEAFAGVSCSSPTACIAVGSEAPRQGGTESPLAYRWDGSDWVPVLAGLLHGYQEVSLNGVSCAAADACMAVGSVSESGRSRPLAEWWNGTTWWDASRSDRSVVSGYDFNGVSCLSSTSCVAVGWNGLDGPIAAHWDGATWAAMAPADPVGMFNSALSAVSCTGPAACVAVGSEQRSDKGVTPLAERWDGTRWAIVSTPVRSTDNETYLAGVSCSDPVDCVAVGTADHLPTAAHLLIERWNGVRWTIEPASTPPGANRTELEGVSCWVDACTAVGGWLEVAGKPSWRTLAERSTP